MLYEENIHMRILISLAAAFLSDKFFSYI